MKFLVGGALLIIVIMGVGVFLNRSYANFYNFQGQQNLQVPKRDDVMLVGS
ncbi:MAG: hypothetical protein ACD_30C00033G0003, partial [uncultured bacterium]